LLRVDVRHAPAMFQIEFFCFAFSINLSFLYSDGQADIIIFSPLRWLINKMDDWKSMLLPAHAHRHERHNEVVVRMMNRIHSFPVKFLSSPGFPGLGFGTVLLKLQDWLPGFLRA